MTYLGDQLGKLDDDVSILVQERLLKSARFWGIYVPPLIDKETWCRFSYRKGFMLKKVGVYRIREQRLQRQMIFFAVVVGASSIVQTGCAILPYLTHGFAK